MNFNSLHFLEYILLAVIISFSFNNAYAQFLPGARQVALVHSDVALSNDVFSIFNNPSGISQISSREIGLSYSPSPFGLKELATGYLSYNEPTSIGNFGLGFMTYGFELYRENKFVLAYANKIGKDFFIGITSFYKTVNISNYGNEGEFNIAIGGIFKLAYNFNLGFSLHNPFRFTQSKIDLPTIYSFGLTNQPIANSYINIAFIKELNFPISARFGLEYFLIEYITLRTGIQNEPNMYSGGIGINYSMFRIDYSFSAHPNLGLSHQAGLIIHFD